MERKDNLPQQVSSNSLLRQNNAGVNLTQSSSSSCSSASPPDFLQQLQNVLKHRKPLAARAARVGGPRRKQSVSSDALAHPLSENNAGAGQTLVTEGAARLINDASEETGVAPVDSSLTPQSNSCTLTGAHEEKAESNRFDLDLEMAGALKKLKLASFTFSSELEHHAGPTGNGVELIQPASFREPEMDEDVSGNRIIVDEQGLYQQAAQLMEMPTFEINFAEGLKKGKEQSHNQQSLHPKTQSTLAQTSCVTAITVHDYPILQCNAAPLPEKTAFPSQKMALESQKVVIPDPTHLHGKGTIISERSSPQDKQALHHSNDIVKKELADNADFFQGQTSSKINPTSKLDIKPPQPSETEKTFRRKKHDSNAYLSVNGKMYRKLGKTGSGGSSEVYKVVSSDCTIYALKVIKLKWRDYAIAYGFCQEIWYLIKLKGKNNIIQLIDYEVTDKALLQQAMEGSITSKDEKIKNDEYIYMVLEYGEVDLAHMLAQKCTNKDSARWNMDDNWLRFYWQQMLEAVNTIHEERIVHSDLKPANFLLVKGSLKLIDFGIAKALLNDTTNIQRDSQAGTLNYMSPEAFMLTEQDLVAGGGTAIRCGRPSDIWSLGCILYQMVYGRTPFSHHKTFWAKFKAVTDESHEIPYGPVANPWLIDLMRRCLAWDRSKRWRIPQLLQHPFLVHLPAPPGLHSPDRARLHLDQPEVFALYSRILSHCSELSSLYSELDDLLSRLEKDRNFDGGCSCEK